MSTGNLVYQTQQTAACLEQLFRIAKGLIVQRESNELILDGGNMKLSNAVLISAVLMLGTSFAVAQERDNRGWDNRDGYLQTVQYNGGYHGNNNADYQRGYQDGINSGRADANGNKRYNLDSHPYYTNSNNQAYREGFTQGYREAYGQDRGHDGYSNGQDGHGNPNNPEYQKGYQDGINSGRADASAGKRSDVESHPYYRNSNNQVYREGFMQGYREAYGQGHGNYHDHNPN